VGRKSESMHNTDCETCSPLVRAFRKKNGRDPCTMELMSLHAMWSSSSAQGRLSNQYAEDLVNRYPYQLTREETSRVSIIWEGKRVRYNPDGTTTEKKEHCNVHYCAVLTWDCPVSPEARVDEGPYIHKDKG